MFSRNFGGISCAATIASRFTGSPSPAASSITARTAYSAFAVTRIATHCSLTQAALARSALRSTQVSWCYPAALIRIPK